MYQDESGFAHDMPRTHGYSPKGERYYAKHDWHARERYNAVGALIGKELLTVSLFECSIDADVFYEWIVQDLLPKLPKNSVIVMDNATFHKRSDILKAITDQQHQLLWLPTYSPDLNPIEKKWAQCKAIKKKLRCSTHHLFKFLNNYIKL